MNLPVKLEYAMKTLKEVMEILESSTRPPCCVKISRERMGCELLGSLPIERFEKECRKCQSEMKKKLKTLHVSGFLGSYGSLPENG